jgi:hypothetical protein
MSTQIITRQTIVQIVSERDAIIEQAMATAQACQDVQNRLSRAAGGVIDTKLISNHMDSDAAKEATRRRITQDVDRAHWRHILHTTGLRHHLTAKRLAEFERTVEFEPPAITVELLMGTLLELAGKAGDMLAESITDLWRNLSSEFKTHSKAPFPDKWIVDVDISLPRWSAGVIERLHEIDRIMAQLDGQPVPIEYQQGLSGLVWRRRGEKVWEAETDLWTAKKFKNGRAHLRTKRPDLIAKLNSILVERGTYLK